MRILRSTRRALRAPRRVRRRDASLLNPILDAIAESNDIERLAQELGNEMGRLVRDVALGSKRLRSVPETLESLGLVVAATAEEGSRGALPLHATRVLGLLVEVIHGYSSDAERPLLADVANILNAVHAAASRGDRLALALPAKWARDLARERRGAPTTLGGWEAVPSPTQLAAGILRALSAELRSRPLTRWKVAGLLALFLRRQFPYHSLSELHSRIYRSMPLNGDVRVPDSREAHRDKVFREELEQTIVAAFKAAGHPKTSADDLFGGMSKAEKRKALRQSRDKPNSSQDARRTPKSGSRSTADGESASNTPRQPGRSKTD
jgi:hypothetical protein